MKFGTDFLGITNLLETCRVLKISPKCRAVYHIFTYTHPDMCEVNVEVVFYVRNIIEHMIPFGVPCNFFFLRNKLKNFDPVLKKTQFRSVIVSHSVILPICRSLSQYIFLFSSSFVFLFMCQCVHSQVARVLVIPY